MQSSKKELTFRKIKFDQNLIHMLDFDGVVAPTVSIHEESMRILLKDLGVKDFQFKFSDYSGLKESEIYSELNKKYSISLSIEKHQKPRLLWVFKQIHQRQITPNILISEFITKSAGRKILLSSQVDWFVKGCLDLWGLSGYFTEIYAVGKEKSTKADLIEQLETISGSSMANIVHYENTEKHLKLTKDKGAYSVLVVTEEVAPETKAKYEWVIKQ